MLEVQLGDWDAVLKIYVEASRRVGRPTVAFFDEHQGKRWGGAVEFDVGRLLSDLRSDRPDAR